MKKLLLFMLTVLFINTSWAQEAPPEMFKFQAYIYKPNGNPVEDKAVGVEISIYQTTINGTLVYTEEFTTTTNKNGIINLEIGNGASTFGTFSEISWEVGEFFLQLSADIDGGTNYTNLGASQLLSVPYALLAKNALSALDDFDKDPTNEIELPETANENDVLTFVNGVWVAQATTESFNFYYADKDGDGFGDKWNVIYADIVPEGYVLNIDCNDNNALINPDAIEICDGFDNNCDGEIDEGAKTTYYVDEDGDGFGIDGITTDACSLPSGYASVGGDCDDTNFSINPGILERCNNGIDDDCDGTVDVNCVTQIGDYFEGGVVFYIFQPDDSGYIENETHGLICSIYYIPTKLWWNGSWIDITTSFEIGSGKNNTDNIIEAQGNRLTDYAAGYASWVSYKGYNDWYLPSLFELDHIYGNRNLISTVSYANGGNFLYPNYYLWSSSQYNSTQAYYKNMTTGYTRLEYKNRALYSRSVRTF